MSVLAGGLACAVGDEDGDVTACAGDGTDEGADEAAGEDVGPDLLDGLPIGQDVGELLVGLLLMLFAADDALNAGDDFRDSEQTDQSGDELEAIQIGKRVLRRFCHIRRGLRRLAAVRLGRVLTRAGRERDEHDRCQKQHDEAFVKTFHVEFLFLLILFDTALRL